MNLNEDIPVWMEDSDGTVAPFNLGQYLMDKDRDPWEDVFISVEE